MELQKQIEGLYAREGKEFGEEYFRAFDEFKQALNEGRVRAAGQTATSVEFEPSFRSVPLGRS